MGPLKVTLHPSDLVNVWWLIAARRLIAACDVPACRRPDWEYCVVVAEVQKQPSLRTAVGQRLRRSLGLCWGITAGDSVRRWVLLSHTKDTHTHSHSWGRHERALRIDPIELNKPRGPASCKHMVCAYTHILKTPRCACCNVGGGRWITFEASCLSRVPGLWESCCSHSGASLCRC